jgi:hypothetical protein
VDVQDVGRIPLNAVRESFARSLAGQSSNDHVQSCLDDIFLELTSCFATKEPAAVKLP